jgi:hypothetical protein
MSVGSAVLWLVGVLLIIAVALVPIRLGAARRRALAAARADAESAYHELGYALDTRTGTEDTLAAARERWNTAGALLADAATAPQCAVAAQCARDGLARLATADRPESA